MIYRRCLWYRLFRKRSSFPYFILLWKRSVDRMLQASELNKPSSTTPQDLLRFLCRTTTVVLFGLTYLFLILNLKGSWTVLYFLQKSTFGYYWLSSGFQIVLTLLAFGGVLLISYNKPIIGYGGVSTYKESLMVLWRFFQLQKDFPLVGFYFWRNPFAHSSSFCPVVGISSSTYCCCAHLPAVVELQLSSSLRTASLALSSSIMPCKAALLDSIPGCWQPSWLTTQIFFYFF